MNNLYKETIEYEIINSQMEDIMSVDPYNENPIRLTYCNNMDLVVYNSLSQLWGIELKNNTALNHHRISDTCTKSIGYIHNYQSLFGMTSIAANQVAQKYTMNWILSSPDAHKVDCKIFDFYQKTWIETNPLECQRGAVAPHFSICEKNIYDTNAVCVVSDNNGKYTAKCDMVKEKWLMILACADRYTPFKTKPITWFHDNPFIIYGTDMQLSKCLDLRSNKSEWNHCHELNKAISNLTSGEISGDKKQNANPLGIHVGLLNQLSSDDDLNVYSLFM